MFALIDCNNFYASCERLFRPDLRKKPVIVLSNNDGCAVARSNEAKALGIEMGEPFFKIKHLCKKNDVAVFSSNYTLYGDISARVMNAIEDNWPEIEIYSIDEAFLNLSSMPLNEINSFCSNLQKKILKYTGIPTSIGVGRTKTLAKIANHTAKKILQIPVFNIENNHNYMGIIDVNEVWGVGRRWAVKLAGMGITKASDLAKADIGIIRKKFNVVLQRTALELRGIPCLGLDEVEPKQSIISSKSFGEMQTDLFDLECAISSHVARAWEKMRQQSLVVSYLSVFVRSNRFRDDLKQYSNSIGFKLITPTDDVRHLTHFAKLCLRKIYKEDIKYKKVGVLFDGLIPKEARQKDIFFNISDKKLIHSEYLMNVLENINHKYGKSTIRLAAEGYYKPWSMKQELKSPNYTTQWSDIPVVLTKSSTKAHYKKAILINTRC